MKMKEKCNDCMHGFHLKKSSYLHAKLIIVLNIMLSKLPEYVHYVFVCITCRPCFHQFIGDTVTHIALPNLHVFTHYHSQ